MRIETDHPIALDSNDHLHPSGCINDSHDATEFCKFIMEHWPEKKTLLDLGTANGTVVSSAINLGFDAFGIEGSDAPRNAQVGQWLKPWSAYDNIRLFNADLRFQFQLYGSDGQPAKFDIITAWASSA